MTIGRIDATACDTTRFFLAGWLGRPNDVSLADVGGCFLANGTVASQSLVGRLEHGGRISDYRHGQYVD